MRATKAKVLPAVSALRDFVQHEASGGYVLMAAAALGLIVANSPLSGAYFDALKASFGFELGPLRIEESLLHWINDGLMALFFLLVGLEIKREILDGQLSTPSRVVLPGVAALAGVALPALVFLAFNHQDPLRSDGWAIPSATDIAFALGVLAMLGKRVPSSLRIFLAAIAIMDDLAAILIIAVFYTAQLHFVALLGAAALIAVLLMLNRFKVMTLWPYLIGGLALWMLVLKSGVHATLAGVALAMLIPLRKTRERCDELTSPLHTLERALHKPVAFLIVPLFGFTNAGLSFAGLGLEAVLGPVPLGVALGLFLGKQVGIFMAAFLLIRLGLADTPKDASLSQLYGVSALCGIGFTMSLFIGNLAFSDPQLIDDTKIGVLVGSLLSAIMGVTVLRFASDSAKRSSP